MPLPPSTQGLRFLHLPYLLTLQLKRFDFDYTTMHRIKLNDRMTFPEELDMSPFIDVEDEVRRTPRGGCFGFHADANGIAFHLRVTSMRPSFIHDGNGYLACLYILALALSRLLLSLALFSLSRSLLSILLSLSPLSLALSRSRSLSLFSSPSLTLFLSILLHSVGLSCFLSSPWLCLLLEVSPDGELHRQRG